MQCEQNKKEKSSFDSLTCGSPLEDSPYRDYKSVAIISCVEIT